MTGAPIERVFRVSWGLRFAIVFGALGLIGVIAFGARETFGDPTTAVSQRTTVAVLLVAFALLGAVGMAFAFRGALVLNERGLRYRSFLRWREHAWKDLAGFRIPPKESRALCILAGHDGRKRLTVPEAFERRAEILEELARRLPDLDLAEAQRAEAAFQSERQFEARFGKTPVDLKTVKRICQAANVLAFALLVGGLVLHPGRLGSPWRAVFAIATLLPAPIALILKRRYGDAVSLDTRRGSQRASLEYALFAGLLAPLPAAVLDFAPMKTGKLWVFGLFPATLLALLIFSLKPPFLARRFVAALVLAVCVAFGYGAAASLNGGLDSSPAAWKATQVVRLTPQRYSNDVAVRPFEGTSSEETVSVDRDTFGRLSVGDTVQVAVRSGALGVPWIEGLRPPAAAPHAAP